MTSSSLATSVPRDVEIAWQTTHAPTATARRAGARVREPDEAELGPREEEVERAVERRARRRRRRRRPRRDSARRRPGTRRAARARRRASRRSSARSAAQRPRGRDRARARGGLHRLRAHRHAPARRRAARARRGCARERGRAAASRGRPTRGRSARSRRASSSPCAEQRDLVGDRRRAEPARRAGRRRSSPGTTASGGTGRRSRRRCRSTGAVADVEPARADQVLVHDGVEVRVVRDVVDVAVRCRCPSSASGSRGSGGSGRALGVSALGHRHPPRRATRRAAVQHPRVEQLDPVPHRRARAGLRDASGSRCWRWRSPRAAAPRAPRACSPSAAGRAPAAGSSTCRPSRSTGARRRPAAARGRSRSRISSTCPRIFMPCCSVHGEWNATRCGPWSIATSGAIFFHSARRRSRPGRARARRSAAAFAGVGGVVREQVAVVLDHHAAAARGDDDRLGAALDVRPPRVDVAARRSRAPRRRPIR